MFDKKAITQALGMVKFLSHIDGAKRHYGKSRLNYGRGENYGNTPVEFSIIFSVDGKYFHFFTSDMRYTRGDCRACIRTCENERDFTGGRNHFVSCIEDLRKFLVRNGVDEQKTYGNGEA